MGGPDDLTQLVVVRPRTYDEWLSDWVYSDHPLVASIRKGMTQMERGQGRPWTAIKNDLFGPKEKSHAVQPV